MKYPIVYSLSPYLSLSILSAAYLNFDCYFDTVLQ